MLIEELAEGLDYFRSKYLTEVIMYNIGPWQNIHSNYFKRINFCLLI